MLHDSFDGIWKAFGTSLRSIDNIEMVHVSTKERVEKLTDYNPPNLSEKPNYAT